MEPPTRSQLQKKNRQEGRARKAAYIAAAASEAEARIISDPHGEEDPPIVADPSLLIAFQPTHTERYRDFLESRADVVSGILHATDTHVLAALLPRLQPCAAWAQLADHEDGGAGRVGFSMHLTRSYPTTHRAASVAAVLAHLHEVLRHGGGGGGGGGDGGDTGPIRLRVQAHLRRCSSAAAEPRRRPARARAHGLLAPARRASGPALSPRGRLPRDRLAGPVRRSHTRCTPHAASRSQKHTAHATRHTPAIVTGHAPPALGLGRC